MEGFFYFQKVNEFIIFFVTLVQLKLPLKVLIGVVKVEVFHGQLPFAQWFVFY